ncbi:MAG: hypothetical protein M3Z37_03320 [Candidatus Eremiobacteraeota bacterium]|nr:hypothetical protein [Candidatus Eremiobacteraeota bacterium]
MNPSMPLPVQVLGILFIVGGILAIVTFFDTLLLGHSISIDFAGILGFWIGAGLLRGSLRWWTWAYVLLWIDVAIALVAFAIFFSLLHAGAGSLIDIRFFGDPVTGFSDGHILLLLVAFLALLGVMIGWALRVLIKHRCRFH